MITLEQFNEVLNKQNLTEEQKQGMIDLVMPFYEFNAYMMEKTGKDGDEVEAMAKEYSDAKMNEYIEYLHEIAKDPEKSVIQESVLLTAKIYGDFARENEYGDSESLETALATYLEIIMLEHFSKNSSKSDN